MLQKPEDSGSRSYACHANGVIARGLHQPDCGCTLGTMALKPSDSRNI